MSEVKNNTLHQYIRSKKNNGRRGVAVAVKCDDGIVRIGYSLHRRTDRPDAPFAKNVAIDRAIKSRRGPIIEARQTVVMVATALTKLHGNAIRYFKGATVELPIIRTSEDLGYVLGNGTPEFVAEDPIANA